MFYDNTLDEILSDAETVYHKFLSWQYTYKEYKSIRGLDGCTIAGKRCACYWRHDKENGDLPRMIIRNGKDSYTLKLTQVFDEGDEKRLNPIHCRWTCLDTRGIADDIRGLLAAHGDIVFET